MTFVILNTENRNTVYYRETNYFTYISTVKNQLNAKNNTSSSTNINTENYLN